MRKTFIALTVITLALAVFSGTGFGFGGQGFGEGGNADCIIGSLSAQEQETFMDIITEYQDLAAELKARMQELREKGDYKAFQETKQEHRELMEERLEELSKVIPEELRTRFESKGQNRHKSARVRGEGNFRQQAGQRRAE